MPLRDSNRVFLWNSATLSTFYRLQVILTASILTLASGASAETPLPLGETFRVNSYTFFDQFLGDVAMADDGSFVVVWSTQYADNGDTSSVQGQRYDSNGTAIGDQFLVNDYTTGSQISPTIANGPLNSFIVSWSSFGSGGNDNSRTSIQARRFNSDAMPIAGQFQVNTTTLESQGRPRVSMTPQGAFVIVWHSESSYGGDTSERSIQGRRFTSNGAPAGNQIQINTYTTDDQADPAVGIDAEGDFIVVWHSSGSANGDSSDRSVQARRYSSNGAPLGDQFLVNSYTTGVQGSPDVAVKADGDFTVVWRDGDFTSYTAEVNIKSQRYLSDGNPLGSQFQVNDPALYVKFQPSIEHDASGAFVVVWSSYVDPIPFVNQYARRFDSNGLPSGEEFKLGPFESFVSGSELDFDAEGNFVVVWNGNPPGDDGYGILGRRFGNPSCLFSNGFESGDTGAWSQAVGQ